MTQRCKDCTGFRPKTDEAGDNVCALLQIIRPDNARPQFTPAQEGE